MKINILIIKFKNYKLFVIIHDLKIVESQEPYEIKQTFR
jgi:hypothetical protein